METYPYPTPEGIIDLVRKSEFDRLKWELDELRSDLTRYSAEREHNANMAGMWQAMAEKLATAAQGYDTTAVEYREWQHAMRDALAAYESAKKGEQP